MRFYADLHIHSKYSRATSKDCDLENLTFWGRKKGITVIGTGDFTHPAWIAEIKEKLVPAEPGLFRLRPDLEKKFLKNLPPACEGTTRFMLSVEISTIYKKDGKVRKIHHLVYAPTIEKAEKINRTLAKIGNIRSDGRPILGLDSRHLLEIVLEAGDDCYLVPAHIWTPWFAVLGSKSGFDSVAECYADLADHVFAVETGLSSDPEMNWRISHLDRYRLMSNSDAHSPPKLGREACVFETELDYYAMRKALQTGKGYGGSIEFFPEEGKYHWDGHRNCNVRFSPEESRAHDGLCPVCNKPLTLGVMYRVEELADRKAGHKPADAADFKSIVPLPELLSEILDTGPSSQKALQDYERMLSKLGSEFNILCDAPLDEIKRSTDSLTAEAISRMREGRVIREAGFDGEYGKIKLFKEEELKHRSSFGVLFELGEEEKTEKIHKAAEKIQEKISAENVGVTRRVAPTNILDPDQQKALEILDGPLLLVAGPGSGKTRTLTHRVAHLIRLGKAKPEECLTITFTKRAAEEMRSRLQNLLPEQWQQIPVMTFHALAFWILQENRVAAGLPRGFQIISEEARKKMKGTEIEGCLTFDELMILAVKLLEEDPDLKQIYRQKFSWVSVDEYQDIDEKQYQLLNLLVPQNGNLCAIGDPDQAIYSFRGSDVRFFLQFEKDFPNAKKIRLTRNYRSGQSILSASNQMIAPSALVEDREIQALVEDTGKVIIHQAPTDKSEAEFIIQTIEQMIGGHSFFSLDTGRSEGENKAYGFSDFVVLYRTDAQADAIEEAFARSGIPFQSRRKPVENSPVQDSFDENNDANFWDPRADRVSLLTLHASKGLEFPIVFIAGCEEGILPLRFGKSLSEMELAEERRLFYVGMTRAKEKLFLSYAAKRFWKRKIRERQASSFLKDIEERLLEREKSQFKKKVQSPQLDLL